MDARVTVAQITGSLPNTDLPKVVKLTKPQTDQAITIHLDGATKLDLTAIGNDNVTFVHAGDRLVILFDNHSTVTIEPFFDSKGLPLSDISVELNPDRSVSGVEFASLFPITTDQSILPAAGDGGSPASGGHFETFTINQFTSNQAPLALLASDSPGGNTVPANPPGPVAVGTGVAGPALGVHDVGGNEDKPITLGITDALSIADARTSLGNLTITGVPVGATLSAGIHNADGSWTLTPAQLIGLTLASDGEVQHFALTVTGTTTDGTLIANSAATLNVSVTPVADTPTLVLGNGEGIPFLEAGPSNKVVAPIPGGLLAAAFGSEDTPIALPIKAALGEVDADAVLDVTISGIPAGVTLSAGTHNADGSVTLTPAQLAGLTLTGDGEASNFALKVTATAVDGGDTATAASLSGTFLVFVGPVSEKPVLAASDAVAASSSVNEDGTVALNITPHFEADKDANNTVTITGLPSGATLISGTTQFAGGNGPITLTEAQLAGLKLQAGDDDTATIKLVVQAHASDLFAPTADSDIQTISLTVNPVAETPTLAASAVDILTGSSVSGVAEGGTVALKIAATPVTETAENDATTTIAISGLGTATLNHPGTANADGSVTLQQSDLDGLTLTAGDNESPIKLTVTASTTDHGSPAATTLAQTISLAVNPVAETPVFTTATVGATTEDHATPLAIAFASNAFEDANDSIAVSVSLSNGAVLLNNGNLVLQDAQGNFILTATSNADLAHLTVLPASEFEGSIVVNITAAGHDGTVFSSTVAAPSMTLSVNALAEAPTLAASAATSTVNEGGTVALNITPTPAEAADTDANTTVTISGLGTATLNHPGTVNQDGSVTLQQSDLIGLTLTAAHDETSTISLQVQAHTSEGGTQADSAVQSITLAVQPGLPVLNATDVPSGLTLNEGDTVALNLTPHFDLNDTDATDTVTITGLPSGTVLSAITGPPGTLAHTIAANQDGSFTVNQGDLPSLTLTAPDKEVTGPIALTVQAHASEDGHTADSAAQTVNLTVNPVADQPQVSVSVNPTVEGTDAKLSITLGNIASLLEDTSNDTVTLTVTLTNGAKLISTDPNVVVSESAPGSGQFSLTATTANDLANLFVRPASESEASVGVTVIATAHDGTANSDGSVAAQTTLTVGPQAESPTLVASAAASSVDEGSTVKLTITPSLPEAGDSDASTSVTISGLVDANGNVIATLNHGATNQDKSVTVQLSDLNDLTLTAADGDATNIHLVVKATATDGSSSASTTAPPIDLAVNPVADKPAVTASVPNASFDANGNILVNEGGTVALTITPQFESGEADASNKIIITGVPTGVSFNQGALDTTTGTLTLTADQLGGLTLTAPNTVGTFALQVTTSSTEGHNTATSDAVTLKLATVPFALQGVEVTTTDEVVFNLVPVSSGGNPNVTLQSVQILGFPDNISNNTSPFVLRSSDGTIIPFSGFSTTAIVTLTHDQLFNPDGTSSGILNGLQLNLGEGSPLALTLITNTKDSAGVFSSVQNSFTLLSNTPIADAPVFVTKDAQGTATVPIQLAVSALTEGDPDETVKITVSGVPSDATLNHGDRGTDANGFTTYSNITVADLATLTLTSSATASESITLKFDATATEGATSASAKQATLHVDVAVASESTPVLAATAAAASVNEDGTVGLNINAAPGDATVTVSGLLDANGNVIATLNHGTVSNNGNTVTLLQSDLHNVNSPLTLTAADGDTSSIHLTLTATTPTSTTPANATIDLAVNPVPDTPTVTASGPTATFDAFGKPTVAVNEGGTVALTITPTFVESDPDVSKTVTISGLAGTGATIVHLNADGSVASGTVGALSGDGDSVKLQLSDLNGLALQAADPAGVLAAAQSFTLHVTSNASEGTGPAANSSVADVKVNVAPIVLQLQQLASDETTFNIVPVSTDSDAVLTSVQIGGFPVNQSNDSTPFVLRSSNGTLLPFSSIGATATVTLTHDQLFDANGNPTGILNGLQSNLPENTPLTLTLTADSTDGGTNVIEARNTFTLFTPPIAEAPGLTAQTTVVTAGSQTPTPLALTVSAEAGEQDVTMRVDASALPATATLSFDTANAVTALTPDVNGFIQLTAAQVVSLETGAAHLGLTSNATTSGNFNLTFLATEPEGATPAQTQVTLPVQVKFDSQATIDTATAASPSVNEDGTVGLTIAAGPSTATASTTVTISGLLDGNGNVIATLNHGTTNADGSVTLTQADFSGLTLHAADGDTAKIHLTAVATSPFDGSTDAKTIDVTVNPVADKPTVGVTADNAVSSFDSLTNTFVPTVSVNENGAVALKITPQFEASEFDAGNTVTISGLAGTGAKLVHQNLDGSIASGTVGTLSTDGNSVTLQLSDLNGLALQAPDTPINPNIGIETLHLHVTATSTEGTGAATTSATSAAANFNVNVGPILLQGVEVHTDDNTRFEITPVNADPDATLQSVTILGIPTNNNIDTTPFEFIDSNGKVIPIDNFKFTPGGGVDGFNNGSVTISGSELQTVLAGGLQLVRLDGNSQPISLEGQVFQLRLIANANETGQGSTPFTLGIAEAPTLATPGVSGTPGTPISLNVNASVGETDTADTALSVTISGLPPDVSLSSGGTPLTISNGSATLTPAQLTGLSLTSNGEDQHFDLSVKATAIDNGNGATAASTTSTLHVDITPPTSTTTVAAQFDAPNNVLNFNNHTVETNSSGQTIQLTANQPGAALHASGNHFTADGSNETLDLSGWDRAVEINFAAGTIKLDATSLTPNGSIAGFANVLGTTHDDFFDFITGGVTVTGGSGTDHFGLAANVLASTGIPTIKNFHSGEAIDLSALLDVKFGPHSDNSDANVAKFVQLKEDAGGNSATLSIDVNGTGNAFVAAAHISTVHSGDTITAILDHAHTTAQLHAHV